MESARKPARADDLAPGPFGPSWLALLAEIEVARNLTVLYTMAGAHAPVKNPFVERSIPSLLAIKAVTIALDAFERAIQDRGLKLAPSQKGQNRHVATLSHAGLLLDPKRTEEAIQLRNRLAHELHSIGFEELHGLVETLQRELRGLGQATVPSDLKFFAERTGELEPVPGVALRQHYQYGVKSGDTIVYRRSWSVDFHDQSSRS